MVATIHYLSMNVPNGQVTLPTTPNNNASASFAYSSLAASTAYNIDWGFGTLTVTNKALTSNVATLTTSVAHGVQVGDKITVTGVDATFNGAALTVTAVTFNTISYAVTHADVGSTGSAGSITAVTPMTTDGTGAVTKSVTFPVQGSYTVTVTNPATGQVVSHKTVVVAFYGTITPTGTVTSTVSNAVVFSTLKAAQAYRVDWGFVSGLVVTNKALTTNVATLTVGAHGWAVGDIVTVTGVDATFNGTFTLTAVAGTTISYAKTASNVTSVASGGSVAGYTPATTVAGTVTKNVTYATAGSRTITVTDDTTLQVAAQKTITVV